MSKTFVQPGNVMPFTAAAAIASGAGLLIGSIFGVTAGAYAIGDEGELNLVSVYNLPKLTTDVIAQGDELYWDTVNKWLTIVPGVYKVVGAAFAAAGNGVLTVECRLGQVSTL